MGRARQLDPLSLIMQTDAAVFLYFARRYDQSIDQFRAVIEREPNFPRTNILASAYAQDGRYDDALTEIKKWRRADDQIWILPLEAQSYAQQGRLGDARRALQDLRALTRGRPVEPWAFVEGYAGVGDKDQAFLWLQKSISEHSPGLTSQGESHVRPDSLGPAFPANPAADGLELIGGAGFGFELRLLQGAGLEAGSNEALVEHLARLLVRKGWAPARAVGTLRTVLDGSPRESAGACPTVLLSSCRALGGASRHRRFLRSRLHRGFSAVGLFRTRSRISANAGF